jgi:ribosomal protein S12 methylthiotransferase accessory factor
LSPEGSIATQVASLLEQLRLGSIRRRTWLLDITTDLGVPVIAALSADGNARGLACGFASRLVASDAAQAAILEMCQVETAFALIDGKRRESGQGGLNEMDHRHLRRGTLDVDACALLHPTGTPAVWAEEGFAGGVALAELIRRLKNHGIDLWLSDLTRSDFDVATARAFAPTLQPFPSTYRGRRLLSVVEEFGGCPPVAAGIEIM